MLKNVIEITGGLPILVWEGEGGACREEQPVALKSKPVLRIVPKNAESPVMRVEPVIQSDLARQGYSQEELYFSNLSNELKERLEKEKQLVRPDLLDGSDCPEMNQTKE